MSLHNVVIDCYYIFVPTLRQSNFLCFLQVTEASSSVAMEALGFERALNTLLDVGLQVEVVATDRSPSVRKMMREQYPDITHQFDVWHTAKDKCKIMCKWIVIHNL